MFVIEGKKKIKCWSCLVCKNNHNKIYINKCSICHNSQQQEKMVINYHNHLLLCKAHSSVKFPILSIMRMLPSPQIYLTIPLTLDSTDLLECVMLTLDNSDEIKNLINYGIYNNKNNNKENKDKNKDKDNKIENNNKENKDNNNNNKKKIKKEFNTILDKNCPKSLFDQVMDSAQTLVYDLNVGQYIAKVDIVDSNLVSSNNSSNYDSNNSSPHNNNSINNNNNNNNIDMELMSSSLLLPNNNKSNRSTIINDTIMKLPINIKNEIHNITGMENLDIAIAHPQHKNNIKHNLVDISASSSSYLYKMAESKGALQKAMCIAIKARDNIDSVTSHRDGKDSIRKVPCGLCGFNFPECELLGKVSNSAIMKWREEKHTDISYKSAALKFENIYDSSKICLFCLQFFDDQVGSSFGDIMVETAAMEDIVFGNNRKELDKELFNYNNDEKTKKILLNKKKASNIYRHSKSSQAISSPLRSDILPSIKENETAFALLHKKLDNNRISISSDSISRIKKLSPISKSSSNTTNILPLRPLSRMQTDMVKDKLRIRQITSNMATIGLTPSDISSDLRSKYTSVTKVMKAQWTTERENRLLEKKLKIRKIQFHKELIKNKLTNNDLGITDNNINNHNNRLNSISNNDNNKNKNKNLIMSPSKGNLSMSLLDATEEHHKRVFEQCEDDAKNAFVSFLTEIRFNNHINQVDAYAKRMNSITTNNNNNENENENENNKLQKLSPERKSESHFFDLGVKQDLNEFFDDRSMPRAFGQPRHNVPKFKRSLTTYRGPIVQEIDDVTMKSPLQKSSTEKLAEEKFKLIMKHALHRKSHIGIHNDMNTNSINSLNQFNNINNNMKNIIKNKNKNLIKNKLQTNINNSYYESTILPSIIEQPTLNSNSNSNSKTNINLFPNKTNKILKPTNIISKKLLNNNNNNNNNNLINKSKTTVVLPMKPKLFAKNRSKNFRPQPKINNINNNNNNNINENNNEIIKNNRSNNNSNNNSRNIKRNRTPLVMIVPDKTNNNGFKRVEATAVNYDTKINIQYTTINIDNINNINEFENIESDQDSYTNDFEDEPIISENNNNNKELLVTTDTDYEMKYIGITSPEKEQILQSCDDHEFQRMWSNAENIDIMSTVIDQDNDTFEFKNTEIKPNVRRMNSIKSCNVENTIDTTNFYNNNNSNNNDNDDFNYLHSNGEKISSSHLAQIRALSRGSRPGSRATPLLYTENIKLLTGSTSLLANNASSREGLRSQNRKLFSRERIIMNSSPSIKSLNNTIFADNTTNNNDL